MWNEGSLRARLYISSTAFTGWTTRSAATAMELPTSRQRSRDQSCRAMRGFLHPDCGPRAAYSNNFQEKRILSKTTSQSPKVNSTPINCARVGKYFRTSEYYYDDFKLVLNNNAIIFRKQLSPCLCKTRDGRAGHHPHQDQLLRNNSDSDLTNFELFCLISAVFCTHLALFYINLPKSCQWCVPIAYTNFV